MYKMKRDFTYCFAAFFMPSILLFHLYNRNHVLNHILFSQVLILAGILAVAGLLLFLAFKFAAGSAEGALLLAVLFWLFFWLFETLLKAATRYFALTSTVFMVLLGAGIIFIAAIFRRYKPPFNKVRPVFNVLAINLAVLFIFNLMPGVNYNLTLNRARAEMAEEDTAPFYIKQNFNIDSTLPAPDIHWFHLDGMMSLETVEHFWGESQENLRAELKRRGFIVYENAKLNAVSTQGAHSALLSPAFYDSFWGRRLAKVETELRWTRDSFLLGELNQIGLTFNDLYMENSEFVGALIYRGYECIRINWYEEVSPLRNPEYHVHFRRGHGFFSGDLPELLTLTTPLNIQPPPHIVERIAIEEQSYHDHEPLARFIWRELFYTHGNQLWRQDPALTRLDVTTVHLYPLAYNHMAKRMLYFIDIVLEENPNAVIVLQSDHGFHILATQQHLLAQGYTLEQVLELMHSVFSAVRIPPEYGGLDAPIAPLNISRELVNRFVGQNYNLLP
jgi:hypothetical protein